METFMIRRLFLARATTALALAVTAFFARGTCAEDAKPVRVLFVCGGGYHDYAKQKDIIAKGITERANVVVTVAYDPDKGSKHVNPVFTNPDWAKDFDVVIHDECVADLTDMAVIDNILKPHKDGLPAVVLHCGMHCFRTEGWDKKAVTPWFELTGLQTTGHGAQLPIEITYEKENPVTKGLTDWTSIKEELYNNIAGKMLDTAKPVARGKQPANTKGQDGVYNNTVVVWTNLYNGKAKVFGTTLGHNNETCADPKYLDLVTHGLLWSVDKLDEAHLKPAK